MNRHEDPNTYIDTPDEDREIANANMSNRRTDSEIRKRIAQIKSDNRMGYKPANIAVNAPLALIQVEGDSAVAALEWALGDRPHCAGSYPERMQKDPK